jgi:hypothetical protein
LGAERERECPPWLRSIVEEEEEGKEREEEETLSRARLCACPAPGLEKQPTEGRPRVPESATCGARARADAAL